AGIAAAHERDVLHRDLKPSNIMVDGRGRIRITDFGLAVSPAEPAAHEIIGTPAYMAPEQLTATSVTERTDIYALGLVLYEVFLGRPLFAAQTLDERIAATQRHAQPEFDPEIDRSVARAISACLQDDPAARPSTVLAVASLLRGGDSLEADLAAGRVSSPGMA